MHDNNIIIKIDTQNYNNYDDEVCLTMSHVVGGIQVLLIILVEKILPSASHDLQWEVLVVQFLRRSRENMLCQRL